MNNVGKSVAIALLLSGCAGGDDAGTMETFEAPDGDGLDSGGDGDDDDGSRPGPGGNDDDGDDNGNGGNDTQGDTDGDTDGRGETEGDDCPEESLGCPCGPGDSCRPALTCNTDRNECEADAPVGCPNDPHEANETLAAAHSFGDISDSDTTGDSITASLEGAGDVDWFTYHGDDSFFGIVDPIRSVATDADVRICKYFDCDLGTTNVSCPPQGTSSTANGYSGCCIDGDSLSLGLIGGFSCTNADDDDSANVWLSVERTNNEAACVGYTLSYHY